MAMPTILPSGQLHPNLLKGAVYVKPNETQTAQNEAPAGKLQGPSQEKIKELEQRLSQDLRDGKLDVIDLSSRFPQRNTETADGRTVVDNSASCGLIVGTYDPSVFTASDAERSAAAGGATHAFLYEDTDFLMKAAKEYATLGDNEVFKFRNIHDVNFVRNALDFFTNGNYSQSEVNTAQAQMEGIVRELAQQIKNGEAPDVSKVQGKLTVGGQDVSMTQLMEMQKTGRELSQSFQGMTSGSLNGDNIQAFAEMGMAKAFGTYYGSTQGELGKQFSAAMDRLYDKGTAQVKKAHSWAQSVSYGAGTASNQAAVRTELDLANLFSKLDTGSKDSLAKSFSSTLAQARSMVQGYCSQYGLPTSHVGLAGATDGISKFFQSWQSRL